MAVSLHSGKWTHEESEYVRELIKEFEAGSLNIEENISLRRFLSKALNCSPKRISKKFEGSLYNGKQLYKRKTSTLTPKEVEGRRNKLRELERKYQESLRVLEMVEASRKPVNVQASLPRTNLTLKGPIALGGIGAPTADAAAALGLTGLSREARIAQLKADIALASMALESNTTNAAAAAMAPRRASLLSTQPDLLAAAILPSSVRAPSPSQLAGVAPSADTLQTQLALNQLLLRGPNAGAHSLPLDIATLATARPVHNQLGGLKRSLEPPAASNNAAPSSTNPVFKRLKLL